jgi:excisionase family DNA binding protein
VTVCDQVSFAAASVYSHPPSEPPPQASAADARPIIPGDGPTPPIDTPRPKSTIKGPRRPRGPPADGDLLDIRTVCHRAGLSRSYVYEAIRRGELIARKYGRLTRILRRDYEAWLATAPPIAPTIARDGAPPSVPITRQPLRQGAPR